MYVFVFVTVSIVCAIHLIFKHNDVIILFTDLLLWRKTIIILIRKQEERNNGF